MTEAPEGYLARRVLDALLREDYGGLRRHVSRSAEPTLPAAVATLRLPPHGRAVRLCRDGFLADHRVAPGADLRLAEVLAALRHLAHPSDDVAAFERECRETLATLRLHAAHGAEVIGRLERSPTYYDVLGAYLDHPVYPTARCRLGLSERDTRMYAPEFGRAFRMRWAAVPGDLVTAAGSRPDWWPAPADVGLPARASTRRDLIPVHPVTAAEVAGVVELAPEPYLEVRPTLSMRTVAVAADPATHLKVPLPVSTLGRRNRRVIDPRILHDGALVQRILTEIRGRARAPHGTAVVPADEQTYGHAGDPLLAYLVRRLPTPDAAAAVPVAALLAPGPGGRYVIEELTDDIAGFFDAYLRVLFGWHVALFGYGIALEAHQQNVSVIPPAAPAGDGDGLRLLVKDNDGALLDPTALARAGLGPADVHDRRMLTADREALARVFVTITLHLCAGALAFGLAERGLLPLPAGLGLVRARLAEAVDEHDQPFLRARTLDADRLPTKAMVTAGTLVPKARTGAQDINKHYGPPGPNYLREHPCF
ncbi:MAG TPA: IucA/IucC family protein [Streptosporangiaceae bacterium]|nr:IucA/IucC family protein [Streptosporangiaceae bacterium]